MKVNQYAHRTKDSGAFPRSSNGQDVPNLRPDEGEREVVPELNY
jgi:hypothetical protein